MAVDGWRLDGLDCWMQGSKKVPKNGWMTDAPSRNPTQPEHRDSLAPLILRTHAWNADTTDSRREL